MLIANIFYSAVGVTMRVLNAQRQLCVNTPFATTNPVSVSKLNTGPS